MLWLLCIAKEARGQQLNIGFIGGTNVTNDVRPGQQTSSGMLPSGEISTSTYSVRNSGGRRPILGLQLEYTIGRNWALEFDALHRELKSTTTNNFSPPFITPDGRAISTYAYSRTLTTWEFPLLAKFRLPLPASRFRPFVTAGPSLRPAGTGTDLSHVGLTAGGGLEFQTAGDPIRKTRIVF